jgi:hypothetical protein
VDFVTSSDDFDTYEVLVEHGNKFLFKEVRAGCCQPTAD